MAIAKTCSCGRRVEAGQTCPCKEKRIAAPPVPEAARNARHPYRRHYSSAVYRKNRIARYMLVGGRCESCGKPLKGELYPRGTAWECDHVIEVADGGDDNIANLRCRCVDCHTAKTKASRKGRRKYTRQIHGESDNL